jgi:hypothetical protein
MSFVGSEPTIPGSERAKTIHALHRSATVTGNLIIKIINIHRILVAFTSIKYYPLICMSTARNSNTYISLSLLRRAQRNAARRHMRQQYCADRSPDRTPDAIYGSVSSKVELSTDLDLEQPMQYRS